MFTNTLLMILSFAGWEVGAAQRSWRRGGQVRRRRRDAGFFFACSVLR